MADLNGYYFSSRHLSAQETVTDLLQSHGANILIHAVTLRSEITLSRANFQLALRKLVEFQPALRMRVASEAGIDPKMKFRKVTKRFQEMEPIEIDFSMKISGTRDQWITFAEEELSVPFNSQRGPLWKVIYVEFPGSLTPGTGLTSGDIYATLPSDIYSDPNYARYTGSLVSTTSNIHITNGHSDVNKQTGVLLFKIHHVIADDVSMLSLIHDQFIPILNDIVISGSLPSFSVQSHMMPSATESFPAAKLSKQLLKDVNFEKALSPKTVQMPVDGVLPPPVPKFGTHQYFMPGEAGPKIWCYKLPRLLSAGLKKACTAHNLPVQEVLIASASIALGVCAEQNGIELPGESVVCAHLADLRQYHHAQSKVHPLGQWVGNDIIKLKMTLCNAFPAPDRFWKLTRKMAETRNTKPWGALSIYPELLNMIHRQETTRPAAEMFKAHFELSSHIKNDGPQSPKQQQQPSPVQPQNYQYSTMGTVTQTQSMGWIDAQSHFILKSVSDISNAPMSLSFLFYQGRTFCNVTYNSRWISEDFVKAFIMTHSQLLTNVCLTKASKARTPARVEADTLPPIARSVLMAETG